MNKSIVLITGGTGTFGSAFIERCLRNNVSEIRILSRDEKKQYDLKQQYKNNPCIKFYIGDIRNKASIDRVMKNVDYVFHAAAMKQIPSCEENPLEAINTNVLGSENVLTSAIENGIKKVVCLSTDKAVYPISTMGATKLTMEKIALQKAKEQSKTIICLTRFCNLISSNGSVVPLFLKQIDNNLPLTVTNPDMTRFMMSLNEAMDLVEQAFIYGQSGDIYIKYTKPCRIYDLANSVCVLKGKDSSYPINIIGARPGEKQHEALLTDEEFSKAKLLNGYIIINANYTNHSIIEYKSDKATLMNQNEILELLNSI